MQIQESRALADKRQRDRGKRDAALPGGIRPRRPLRTPVRTEFGQERPGRERGRIAENNMPPVTFANNTGLDRACRDLAAMGSPPEIAQRVERLEVARMAVWDALRAPGAEGRSSLFARLEDLQDALEALRRDLGTWWEHPRGFEDNRDGFEDNLGESVAGGRGGESDRAQVVAAVRRCQETLRRMDQVFSFLGELIEERSGDAAGVAYSFSQPGGGRRQVHTSHQGSGNWEG